MGMCVVMAGTLGDGFYVYGPFNNSDEAFEWAEARLEDWEVMTLLHPTDCAV